MGATLGVSFVIGASLASSVSSSFASVQDKLRATRAAFAEANRKAKGLDSVIAARSRLDALQAKMRAEGASAADIANIRKLAEAYARAAREAGVYGQSLARIRYEHDRANVIAANSQRSMAALQTAQRGRDIRSEESGKRQAAISRTAADLAPLAGLAAPIKIGMDFDAAMSKVAAISGATGSQFDALRAQARQLGATTVWSAKEAAEGMSFLAMAGFKTHETMAAMPGMLSLASAGGMDLATTADIASNILTGFGKSAGEMGKVGDILAQTFTNSNTSIASLGESFKYCAPVAANAGQAFESVAAMIGKLGDAGIQGSMAGTGLNAIIGRMASPPEEAAVALKKLGVRVADSAGKMRPLEDVFAEIEKKMGKFSEQERIALAKALYGAEHFAKGFVLQIAAAGGSLDELKEKINKASGRSDRLARTQTDNLAGDFKQLNSAMQEVAICITEVVTPPLRQLLGQVTPMVQGIGVWIRENPRLTQGIMALGGAFLALKVSGLAFTLLNSYRRSFVGGLISMRGQAMRPLAAVRNGFASLRVELSRPVGNPFSGAARGASSFGQSLVSLRSSIGQTLPRLRQLSAASMAAGAKAAISGAVAATGRAGWNMLRLGIRGVGMAFKTVFGPMNLLIMGLSMGADYIIENWDKIAPYFQALWDGVKSIFTSVMGWLQPIFDAIASLFDPFVEKIRSFIGSIGGMIEKVGAVWDWITGNDKEKAKKEQQRAEADARKREITKGLPVEAQKALEADVKAPAAAAVSPPAGVAVQTPMQARETGKKEHPYQKAQAQMAAMEAENHAPGAPAASPAPKRPPAKSATPAADSAPGQQAAQAGPPQVRVEVNITQNGVPDQTFAQGVIRAIRGEGQKAIEEIVNRIVGDQARLAYGG